MRYPNRRGCKRDQLLPSRPCKRCMHTTGPFAQRITGPRLTRIAGRIMAYGRGLLCMTVQLRVEATYPPLINHMQRFLSLAEHSLNLPCHLIPIGGKGDGDASIGSMSTMTIMRD